MQTGPPTVSEDAQGQAIMVARQAGVIAGLATAPVILAEMDIEANWQPAVTDGDRVNAGQELGSLSGRARDLLTAERLLLNFLGQKVQKNLLTL